MYNAAGRPWQNLKWNHGARRSRWGWWSRFQRLKAASLVSSKRNFKVGDSTRRCSGGHPACRRAVASPPSAVGCYGGRAARRKKTHALPAALGFFVDRWRSHVFFRAAGRAPSTSGRMPAATSRRSGGHPACRRAVASSPAEKTSRTPGTLGHFVSVNKCAHPSRAAGRAPSTSGRMPDATGRAVRDAAGGRGSSGAGLRRWCPRK